MSASHRVFLHLTPHAPSHPFPYIHVYTRTSLFLPLPPCPYSALGTAGGEAPYSGVRHWEKYIHIYIYISKLKCFEMFETNLKHSFKYVNKYNFLDRISYKHSKYQSIIQNTPNPSIYLFL